MDKEFDNEIDALLRREAGGRTITISEFASLHLDADEISAFAENALPDTTKQKYIAHFADCEGCRQTLSSVILLNAEAGPEIASAAAAPAVAETAVPWYKKLFLLPNAANLAYVMGALVLMLGGFLAFSVYNNLGGRGSSEISQIDKDEPRASGPSAVAEEGFYNANMAIANSANTAADTNSAADSAPAPMSVANTAANTSAVAREISPFDRADGARITSAPPPPSGTPQQPAVTETQRSLQESVQKPAIAKEEEKADESCRMRSLSNASPGAVPRPAAPARNKRDNAAGVTLDGVDQQSAEQKAKSEGARKQAGGRTFELRQGAWYDSSYRGQAATNVRRGSDDYKKLDGGLRSIAESISGTVVVVWNGRAYRIQ